MDLRAYLESKGVRVKGSGDQAHMACVFHAEDSGKRGRLYVNVSDGEEQGLYTCFVCGAKGNLRTLMRHFGDDPESLPDDSAYAKQSVLQDAAQFYADNLHPKVAEWLQKTRGLSNETIAERRLGWAPSEDDTALYRFLRSKGHKVPAMVESGLVVERNGRFKDFLVACVTIPYFVHGSVVQIRGKEMAGKYLTPPGQTARLFNVDSTYEHEVLIITEGELDCMVLSQLGFDACGVPGAKSWKQAWNKNFEDVRRVHILFDPDEAGRGGAIKVQDQLGAKARICDLPVPLGIEDKEVDPTYLVVQEAWGRSEFEEVIARSLASSNILVSVDEAFEEWEEVQGAQGFKLGFEELDWAIAPGLLPSQVMVVLAKTNCLAGDTELCINRGGKGFRMNIADLAKRFAGERRSDWNPSTPTKIQRCDDEGYVRQAIVRDVWCAGEQETWTLATESGKSLRGTAEHLIATKSGFVKLGDLSVGDDVLVNGGRSKVGTRKMPSYRARGGLKFHPFATRRNLPTGGWGVQLHRLVVEADLNGMSLDSFLDRCRQGPVDDLQFIDPEVQEVHHRDGNRLNNDLSNLDLLSMADHLAHHADERHVLERVVPDRVISITAHGLEMTYDLEVEDDPHNFIADGFVVHNSGKTLVLLNIFQRMCMVQPDLKVLFVSLEQTRGDWFERARRIWNFYNLDCDFPDLSSRTLDFWRPRLELVDKNRVSEAELITAIEEYEARKGSPPDVVAVDYLGYWAAGFKGRDRYEKVSDAIMSLKAVAKDRRVAIISPHQVNRTVEFGVDFDIDSARESGVTEETADFALSLWSPDSMKGLRQEEKSGVVHIKIGKSRHGGKGNKIDLQFAPLSLAMVPIEDRDHLVLARDELRYQVNKERWQQAIWRHRHGVSLQQGHAPSLEELEGMRS